MKGGDVSSAFDVGTRKRRNLGPFGLESGTWWSKFCDATDQQHEVAEAIPEVERRNGFWSISRALCWWTASETEPQD